MDRTFTIKTSKLKSPLEFNIDAKEAYRRISIVANDIRQRRPFPDAIYEIVHAAYSQTLMNSVFLAEIINNMAAVDVATPSKNIITDEITVKLVEPEGYENFIKRLKTAANGFATNEIHNLVDLFNVLKRSNTIDTTDLIIAGAIVAASEMIARSIKGGLIHATSGSSQAAGTKE